MSLQRFYILQNCVRFDDKSTREERKKIDNMAHIRVLFDQFVDCCHKAHIPHEYMTIDEMLLAFRGRCGFRVYIPSKPAKYGIKIQAPVDAKSFYTFSLEVYAGKQPTGLYAVSNKAFDVVERLVQPISQSNRNLIFDNCFTSHELMLHLLTNHRLTSTGTVRQDTRCIPNTLLKTGKEPGSSLFCFQKDITLVSYAPKNSKVVIAMSTLHHDDKIDETTGDKNKPEIITFYNSTKAGADVVDELCATYKVSGNSKRWRMTIFYGILNIAASNTNIIFRENVNQHTKRTYPHFGISIGVRTFAIAKRSETYSSPYSAQNLFENQRSTRPCTPE
ncbi:PiggyBac transposable element-derived protein 4 [Anthophora plagiata]